MARDVFDYIRDFEDKNSEYSEEIVTKKEVMTVIKEFGEDIFARKIWFGEDEDRGNACKRFLKAIGSLVKDEEILEEIFRIDTKKAIQAIAAYTDLLENEETELLAYNCAIRRYE